MKIIILDSNTRFTKFYIVDLFTNELIEVDEHLFDTIVTKHRCLYEMKYDKDNINVQNFFIDGQLQARRERV